MDNRQTYAVYSDDGDSSHGLTIDDLERLLPDCDMNDIEWACQEEGVCEFDGFRIIPE